MYLFNILKYEELKLEKLKLKAKHLLINGAHKKLRRILFSITEQLEIYNFGHLLTLSSFQNADF